MTPKSDVIVKLVLVFFISLLSFSIGTFVGKKYSDNQHKLAQLESGKGDSHREIASSASHGEVANHDPSVMTDDEIAKLAEEFVADDTAEQDKAQTKTEEKAEPHGTVAEGAVEKNETVEKAENAEKKEAPAVVKKVEEKEAQPMAVAKKVAEGKKPETAAPVKKAESRLPSSLPKDVNQYSVGKFTVQVASYSTETEAQKKAAEMKTHGYSAFYVPATVKGKTWYRVSVGLFATEKEAKDYKVDKKMGAAIVQKITN